MTTNFEINCNKKGSAMVAIVTLRLPPQNKKPTFRSLGREKIEL